LIELKERLNTEIMEDRSTEIAEKSSGLQVGNT